MISSGSGQSNTATTLLSCKVTSIVN